MGEKLSRGVFTSFHYALLRGFLSQVTHSVLTEGLFHARCRKLGSGNESVRQ
jgi:hypothetical protein